MVAILLIPNFELNSSSGFGVRSKNVYYSGPQNTILCVETTFWVLGYYFFEHSVRLKRLSGLKFYRNNGINMGLLLIPKSQF